MKLEHTDEELEASIDRFIQGLVPHQQRDPSFVYQHVGVLLKVCAKEIERLGDSMVDGGITSTKEIGILLNASIHHLRTAYVMLVRVIKLAEKPHDTV